MFRNYLKIAARNLAKNKVHSFINIAGLSTGMAVAILIGLWIWGEVSFNQQFPNNDRIARVMQHQSFDGEIRTGGSVPRQLAPVLRNTYGHHFKYVVLSNFTNNSLLSVGKKLISKSGNFMEPDAPSLLSLHMLKGSRAGLGDPNSILLSASTAEAMFGTADPMNKLLTIDNKMDVKVTGVYEDLPVHSSFENIRFIAPWELLAKTDSLDKRKIGWGNNWFQILVQVNDQADMATISAHIKNAKADNLEEEGARYKPTVSLHPLNKWYLYSEFKNGVVTGGRIQYIWLFGIIGLFVLLLACINFMNLSTARSEKRSKEVGIRKAVGSLRGQLISQFFTESLVVAGFAFIFSLLLVQLMLPWFNDVAGKEISLPWSNLPFWTVGIGFTLITGLIAGTYPALYLSSFKPVKVLKGIFKTSRMAAVPRKVLVVLQFTVSVTLIICTIVVFRQIQFAKDRPEGFNKNSLVTIPLTREIKKHYDAFRNELLSTGAVTSFTKAQSSATNAGVTNSGLEWSTKPPGMQDIFFTVATDHDYGKTYQWEMVQGRNFSPAMPTDSFGFILNETAVKYMGFKNPIGEEVKAFGKKYHIIGVAKDMVLQSPYEPINPMIFYIDAFNRVNNMIMKLDTARSSASALAKVEAVFKEYDSFTPFTFRFADEEYDDKFKSEETIGKLASFFAILAIFISCMGLFGMASFMAEQRTKEIGVRKVLGATTFNLWRLLSKDFVALVIISLVIAIPLATYFMYGWLQNYQYRTAMSWWIFAAAGAGALVITLLTVSYQSISAALTNPVKCLRTE